jgi:hypothetical protein
MFSKALRAALIAFLILLAGPLAMSAPATPRTGSSGRGRSKKTDRADIHEWCEHPHPQVGQRRKVELLPSCAALEEITVPGYRKLTINLAPELHDKLQAVASERSITVSELIRRAVALDLFIWEHRGAELLLKEGDSVKEIVRA